MAGDHGAAPRLGVRAVRTRVRPGTPGARRIAGGDTLLAGPSQPTGGRYEQHRRRYWEFAGDGGGLDDRHGPRGGDGAGLRCRSGASLLSEPGVAAGHRYRPRRLPAGADDAAAVADFDPLREGHHGDGARLPREAVPGGQGRRRRPGGSRQPWCRRQRGGGAAEAPGVRLAGALVLRVRVVQRPGRQRLAAPGGHDPHPRPGLGGLTWTSPRWPVCCTKPPSITTRTKRWPRRTTGGTGTPPTWTRARPARRRTTRPRPPGATWPRSSRSSSPDARASLNRRPRHAVGGVSAPIPRREEVP